MGLEYALRKLKSLNVSGMMQALSRLKKKTGKSRVWLFWDIVGCARRHGAGYIDYENCGLYMRSEAERATYLTGGRNNELWRKYNDPAFRGLLDDKVEFAKRFDAFFHRDWVEVAQDTKEQMLAFMEKHPTFLVKPRDGCCGRGIEWVRVEGDLPTLYEKLLNEYAGWICEEPIKQHEELCKVYPKAVNTLRAVTILKDGTPKLVCTYWRIGAEGESVDNFNHGGMVVPVERETGKVLHDAVNKKGEIFANHPATGTPISGFVFPDWDKAQALVLKAATIIPQVGYVGWDVAFTDKGPCLVEGNPFPGHDIYQLICHTDNGQGILPLFAEGE